MYDEESRLYYLQSRYYDPVTGRFVNADGFVSTGTGLMGYNMFAYCNSNPVMHVDPTGARPVSEIQQEIDELEIFIKKYAIAIRTSSLNNRDLLHYTQQLSALKQELAEKKMKVVTYPVGGSTGPGETYDGHGNARDIAALEGTPIFAAMGGEVTAVVMCYSNDFNYNPRTGIGTGGATAAIVGEMASYGNYIDIQVWDGTTIRYAHQQSSFVKVGDIVSAGQQIGLIGNVGCSTGGHLYIEASKGNVLDYFLH